MSVQKNAQASPTRYRFRMGEGYQLLGEPRMPIDPVGEAEVCEPEAAEDGSLHALQPPKGAEPMPMRWNPAGRSWTPIPLGVGRRMAYTSAYLAANGWTYVGPFTVPEE